MPELAILELDFTDQIRYCSKAFTNLLTEELQDLQNRKIEQWCSPADGFTKARHELANTGKRSVNFAIQLKNFHTNEIHEIEAQGVLVRTRHEGFDAHSVFYVLSNKSRRLKTDFNLSPDLLNITGFQSDIFARYLSLLESSIKSREPAPPPPTELCRICERPVKTWWFERHHWLCAREHKQEERVIRARDSVIEHKKRILDSTSKSRLWLKHSVKISSPLSVHHKSSHSLLDLVHFCDQALMLDVAESRQSVDMKDAFTPFGKNNYAVLRALKTPPEMDNPLYFETVELVTEMAVVFERFVKFRQYRKLVWQEVETQVYLAIDKLVASVQTYANIEFLPEHALESDDERSLSGQLSGHVMPGHVHGHVPGPVSKRPSRANLNNRRHSTASLLSLNSQMSSETEPAQLPSVHDYEGVGYLSRGSYGSVYLAKKRVTGDLFAIKVLRKKDMVAKRQVTHIKHERRVLIASAASPYIATLYYSFQSTDFLYLVLEYVPNGDLRSLLKSVGLLSEELARQYISELALAVNSVHRMGILHRDLKPENLLIDKSGHLKLSDFGLSVPIDEQEQQQISKQLHNDDLKNVRIIGTPDYISPEAINGYKLRSATDWWSVGCILFEFVYGYPPFNDETPQLIFENILGAKIAWPDLPPELDISKVCRTLIVSLLAQCPYARLSFNQVKCHPFFESVLWDRVYSTKSVYIPQPTDTHKKIPPGEAEESELVFPNENIDLVFSLKQEESTVSSSSSSLHGSPLNSFPTSPHLSTHSGSFQSLNHSHGNLFANSNSHSPKSSPKGSPKNSPKNSYPNSMSSSFSSIQSMNTSPAMSPYGYGLRKPSRSQSFTRPEHQIRLDEERSEFGSFSYRNLDILEQKNNEVINKIKATPDLNPASNTQMVPEISLNDTEFKLRVLVGGNQKVAEQMTHWGCDTTSCYSASDVCLLSQTNAFHLIVLNFKFDDKLPESEVIKIIRETLNPSRDCIIYQLQPNWETDLLMILSENFGFQVK